MKKFTIVISLWIISLLFVTIWTYENPEKIEILKNYFKKNKNITAEIQNTQKSERLVANSFFVKISKIISFSEKTAFIVYPENKPKFDPKNLIIYSQNGFVMKDLKSKKLNLPKTFTLQRNGGIKTIFFSKNDSFALL